MYKIDRMKISNKNNNLYQCFSLYMKITGNIYVIHVTNLRPRFKLSACVQNAESSTFPFYVYIYKQLEFLAVRSTKVGCGWLLWIFGACGVFLYFSDSSITESIVPITIRRVSF